MRSALNADDVSICATDENISRSRGFRILESDTVVKNGKRGRKAKRKRANDAIATAFVPNEETGLLESQSRLDLFSKFSQRAQTDRTWGRRPLREFFAQLSLVPLDLFPNIL
jgi:hypothetical protein